MSFALRGFDVVGFGVGVVGVVAGVVVATVVGMAVVVEVVVVVVVVVVGGTSGFSVVPYKCRYHSLREARPRRKRPKLKVKRKLKRKKTYD